MNKAKGFTLIELMIVVAIIAILAAIALPAYQDYLTRAQVAEGMQLSRDAQMSLAAYWSEKGEPPADNAQAGLAMPTSITGNYVEQVEVNDTGEGQILVTFGNDASSKISGQNLILELSTDGGSIAWACSGLDDKYLPSICD